MSARVLRVGSDILTVTDIIKINSTAKEEDIIVEIDNTKGQDSELFKRFAPNVAISILGGLNYVEKDKFNDQEYRDRTLYQPKEVTQLIKTFEKIESRIDPSWSQLEKAIYVYKIFTENINYNDYALEEDISNRNLLVLLTKRGICSGISLLYKEAMDRLGIPCEYQNKQHHHCWNVLTIDDKYIAVDLTWDINDREDYKDGKCHFTYFGNDQDFYNNKHHDIFEDKDEKAFNITTIPEDTLREAYQHIMGSNSHEAPITNERLNDYNIDYSIDQINDHKICLYRVNNQLYVNYYQEEISKENLFKFNSPDQNETDETLPKYKIYKREDNTSFCIIKDLEKEDSYFYLEFNDELHSYKRYKIMSETNLIKPYDENEEKTIANKLLNPKNLLRKVEYFNGYVGWVNTNVHKEESDNKDLNGMSK